MECVLKANTELIAAIAFFLLPKTMRTKASHRIAIPTKLGTVPRKENHGFSIIKNGANGARINITPTKTEAI